jgi:hypothetical protein
LNSPGTLSVLDHGAASKFHHFCRLSVDNGKDVFVIHPKVFAFQNIGPLDEFGVEFGDLFELEAYGLIRSSETILLNYGQDPDAIAEEVDYAGQRALLNLAGTQSQQIIFTRAGRELRRLFPLRPVPAFTDILEQQLQGAFKPKP